MKTVSEKIRDQRGRPSRGRAFVLCDDGARSERIKDTLRKMGFEIVNAGYASLASAWEENHVLVLVRDGAYYSAQLDVAIEKFNRAWCSDPDRCGNHKFLHVISKENLGSFPYGPAFKSDESLANLRGWQFDGSSCCTRRKRA